MQLEARHIAEVFAVAFLEASGTRFSGDISALRQVVLVIQSGAVVRESIREAR